MSQEDRQSYFQNPFYGCSACGADIENFELFSSENINSKLKNHRCTGEEACCDAIDIEETYFKTSRMWSTFFRASMFFPRFLGIMDMTLLPLHD